MKKRTETEIEEYYIKLLKGKFIKYPLDLVKKIQRYTHGDYKPSCTEAIIYGSIDLFSRLDNHCFTSSTRALQEITGASRSTVVRALNRLEENKVIIKLETNTTVPYYVTYELYFARLYHWVYIEKYYPTEVLAPLKPYHDIIKRYPNDATSARRAVESLMRLLHVEKIDLTKELKTADFYGKKQTQNTYF
jgi:hypothetical protein